MAGDLMPGLKIKVVGMPKKNQASDMTDKQVRILLRKYAGQQLCLEDLVDKAKEEMPGVPWNNDKVRHSIDRLEAKGEVRSIREIRDNRMVRIPCLCLI